MISLGTAVDNLTPMNGLLVALSEEKSVIILHCQFSKGQQHVHTARRKTQRNMGGKVKMPRQADPWIRVNSKKKNMVHPYLERVPKKLS
jgi:hypothetical protein